ncbi:MAG: hypothetical protein ACYS8X_04360 [Planctomycetota bacterium]|jgi:hypothetical protein
MIVALGLLPAVVVGRGAGAAEPIELRILAGLIRVIEELTILPEPPRWMVL